MYKLLLSAFLSLLALTLATPGMADSSELTLVSAINKAGRQRMLSQRIVKSYAAIGLDIHPIASRKQLREAVNEFDSNLDALKVFFVPTPAIRTALDEVGQLWAPYREVALAPVTKAGAQRLLDQDAKLLAAAEKVVRLYQSYAGYSFGRLVNLSGRQRMLSQRITKLHFLRVWGLGVPDSASEMKKARDEFEKAFWELEIAPQNNYEINRELEDAATQWNWFTSAIDQEGDPKAYILIVNDAAESLLSNMDFLTSLYEAEANR